MLDKLIKSHVLRLLKTDMVAVLTEIERQGEVSLAVEVNSAFGCISCLLAVHCAVTVVPWMLVVSSLYC